MCVALSILGLPRALKLQVNIPSNRDQVHINPSKTWQKNTVKNRVSDVFICFLFFNSRFPTCKDINIEGLCGFPTDSYRSIWLARPSFSPRETKSRLGPTYGELRYHLSAKKKLLQNCPKSASYLKCHIDIPPHVRVLPFSHHNPNCTPWNVQLITKNVKLPVVSQLYLQVETISSMDVFPLEVYRYMKKINCLT